MYEGKSFSQQTNSNGYVTLSGKPGTWQFTITKEGYTTQSWSQDISATTTKQAFFPASTPIIQPVTLTLHVHDGGASGPLISGVAVTGIDADGKSFSQQTNSNGYVTLSGKPGTWQFTITKSGYTTTELVSGYLCHNHQTSLLPGQDHNACTDHYTARDSYSLCPRWKCERSNHLGCVCKW